MTQVHSAAQSGYSKASARYETGRPGYPAEVERWLRDVLEVRADKRVVDLGAGTGKFTAHLIQTGADVIAVEPVSAMLDRLQQNLPDIDARQGYSTAIPMSDSSVDAVFCAQSFHWFATKDTLKEIARILKPQGILALVWNVRDETCDWVAHLSRIIEPFEEGTPRFHHGHWRHVFPDDGYTALQEQTFEHAHHGDFKTVVVDRVLSISFIAALPPEKRADVEQQLWGLLSLYPQLANQNDISFPYQTLVAWTQKR